MRFLQLDLVPQRCWARGWLFTKPWRSTAQTWRQRRVSRSRTMQIPLEPESPELANPQVLCSSLSQQARKIWAICVKLIGCEQRTLLSWISWCPRLLQLGSLPRFSNRVRSSRSCLKNHDHLLSLRCYHPWVSWPRRFSHSGVTSTTVKRNSHQLPWNQAHTRRTLECQILTGPLVEGAHKIRYHIKLWHKVRSRKPLSRPSHGDTLTHFLLAQAEPTFTLTEQFRAQKLSEFLWDEQTGFHFFLGYWPQCSNGTVLIVHDCVRIAYELIARRSCEKQKKHEWVTTTTHISEILSSRVHLANGLIKRDCAVMVATQKQQQNNRGAENPQFSQPELRFVASQQKVKPNETIPDVGKGWNQLTVHSPQQVWSNWALFLTRSPCWRLLRPLFSYASFLLLLLPLLLLPLPPPPLQPPLEAPLKPSLKPPLSPLKPPLSSPLKPLEAPLEALP